MRFLIFFIFGFLFNSILFAQPQAPPPPKFDIIFSNSTPKVGDEIDITFKCKIPEGLHMYSTNNKCEVGPQTFEIIFNSGKNYKLVGKLKSVGDKVHKDEIFDCEVGEFVKNAEFKQKIKVLSNSIDFVFDIRGQWCTDASCFSFGGDMSPLKVKSTLKASGTSINEIEENPSNLVEKIQEEVAKIDSPKVILNIDSNKVENPKSSYRKKGDNDNSSCEIKKFNGVGVLNKEGDNLWGLFLLAFLSGLAGLLTPCVFPMIPMTISFFMKDDKKRTITVRNGLFFGLFIVGIYVILGSIVAALLGPEVGNFLSTHWFPNMLFFIVFLIFAFSFFGAFELVLPSSLTNKVDKEADKGGLYGVFFMALTLAIVSFSCTGPIVGTVLVESAKGTSQIRPIVAMLGFGLAFALPFSLFAIFPHWLKSLPKSGGWLNSVKVVFGFLELALALKFLSIIDQTYHWHILDREVYLSLWIVIFALMGVYLLGKIKFSHDSDIPYLKVPRLLFTILTFSFVMYLIPGLWGAPLKALSGYLPPMSTQDFDINRIVREANGIDDKLCSKPSYAEKLHIPHGLSGYFDYDEAIACGKEQNKPVFIDFTGHGCVNCRKMEEYVWSDPRVLKILNESYVIASLYVDDKKIPLKESDHFISKFNGMKVTKLGDKNAVIQMCYFNANSQPLYCLLDGNEDLLQQPVGTEINGKSFDKDEFYNFLEAGLKEYKKRNPEIKK